ncbi:hypothetical protein K438DRAFT_2155539 [Mycena galopus ATCC 62051]|nr:hypothetical protein K438DRAFT_2155539 [Mycena galopus ATCC 62051]
MGQVLDQHIVRKNVPLFCVGAFVVCEDEFGPTWGSDLRHWRDPETKRYDFIERAVVFFAVWIYAVVRGCPQGARREETSPAYVLLPSVGHDDGIGDTLVASDLNTTAECWELLRYDFRGRCGGSGDLRRTCGEDVACDGGDVLVSDGDFAVLEVERYGVECVRDRLDLGRDGGEVACAERGLGVREVGDDPREDLLALVEGHEATRDRMNNARMRDVGLKPALAWMSLANSIRLAMAGVSEAESHVFTGDTSFAAPPSVEVMRARSGAGGASIYSSKREETSGPAAALYTIAATINADLLKNMMKASQEGGKRTMGRGWAVHQQNKTRLADLAPDQSSVPCRHNYMWRHNDMPNAIISSGATSLPVHSKTGKNIYSWKAFIIQKRASQRSVEPSVAAREDCLNDTENSGAHGSASDMGSYKRIAQEKRAGRASGDDTHHAIAEWRYNGVAK